MKLTTNQQRTLALLEQARRFGHWPYLTTTEVEVAISACYRPRSWHGIDRTLRSLEAHGLAVRAPGTRWTWRAP